MRESLWESSHRADPRARVLADRHYNRQKIGTPQFVPPGRCCVLLSTNHRAFWITSWPFGQYVKHAWPDWWVCSAFRSEDAGIASDLIRDAVAASAWHWAPLDWPGIVTFIDRRKVKPVRVRGKDMWGWTWLKAGFEIAGETKGGLLALTMSAERMPDPLPALPFTGVRQ